MKIVIKNAQRKITIDKRFINYLARHILKIKGIKKAELGILFVGQSRIRTLNKKFRKINQPTDVLAFRMHEGKGANLHPELLGDVVICPEIARKRTRIYHTTEKEEVYLYVIHGILHLLGYKDTNRKMSSLMEKEQVRILKEILKR